MYKIEVVAQACSLTDLTITDLAKRNIGALTENIEKTPYKLLFNDSTNSFSLYNNVQFLRAVDSCIAQNETTVTGRKRLVLVHGKGLPVCGILNCSPKLSSFPLISYILRYISLFFL